MPQADSKPGPFKTKGSGTQRCLRRERLRPPIMDRRGQTGPKGTTEETCGDVSPPLITRDVVSIPLLPSAMELVYCSANVKLRQLLVSGKINLRPRPEEDELRSKRLELEHIEKELVEKELQLTSLRAELADFERLYLKIVGVLYAELDEIEARIAELIAHQNGSNPDAQNAARQARRKATESHSALDEAALEVSERFRASPELKNLYREVARRIHPDLATSETDRARRQRFMAQANRAYEEGDEARLRSILEEYESSPDTVLGEGVGAELVRVIRKIAQVRRRLAEIEGELKLFMHSELMELKNGVEEGRTQGHDILAEMARAVGLRIDEAKIELNRLSKEPAS